MNERDQLQRGKCNSVEDALDDTIVHAAQNHPESRCSFHYTNAGMWLLFILPSYAHIAHRTSASSSSSSNCQTDHQHLNHYHRINWLWCFAVLVAKILIDIAWSKTVCPQKKCMVFVCVFVASWIRFRNPLVRRWYLWKVSSAHAICMIDKHMHTLS